MEQREDLAKRRARQGRLGSGLGEVGLTPLVAASTHTHNIIIDESVAVASAQAKRKWADRFAYLRY